MLKNTSSKICEAASQWAQLRTDSVVYILNSIFDWQLSFDDASRSCCFLLSNLIATELGNRHPVATVMRGVLCQQLPQEIWWYMLAMVDSKMILHPVRAKDKEEIIFQTRESLALHLGRSDEYEMMERMLDLSTPMYPFD